jgi:DHA1 family bicyclomycin/chloramphenicol resistance-like MFS transporter
MLQISIAVNFLGFCLMSLIAGPISDNYGRKPVLLLGSLVLCVSSLASSFSSNIEWFIFARFMQGIGAGMLISLTMTMIFDIFDENKAQKIVSNYYTINSFLIASSPLIGGYINRIFEWQTNFYFIAALTFISFSLLLFFFTETNPHRQEHFHFKKIFKNYLVLLKNKAIFSNFLLICFAYSGYMSFITIVPFLYVIEYGLSEQKMEICQLILFLAFTIGNLLCPYALKILPASSIKLVGLSIQVFGAISMILVILFFKEYYMYQIIAMFLFQLGTGLSMSFLVTDIMKQEPLLKGTASGLISSGRLFSSSIIVASLGYFYQGNLKPFALYIFLYSIYVIFFIRSLSKPYSRSDLGVN